MCCFRASAVSLLKPFCDFRRWLREARFQPPLQRANNGGFQGMCYAELLCFWAGSTVLRGERMGGGIRTPRKNAYWERPPDPTPDPTDQSHAPEATRPQIRFRPGSR